MHSNYNLNYNNNYSSLHLPDNGFQYFINGMQLLNPKWTTGAGEDGDDDEDGGDVGGPPGPISPAHAATPLSKKKAGGGGSVPAFAKAAIFQTATNAAGADSEPYCNMFLQSQYELEHRQLQAFQREAQHRNYQQHHQQQQQQQQQHQQRSKHHFRNPSQVATHHKKHNTSPPPFVHQQQHHQQQHQHNQKKDTMHRMTAALQHDNNNKHHQRAGGGGGGSNDHHHHHQQHLRRQQQQSMQSSQRSESPDSEAKRLSTDQHYQHYYSYYYNRQPDPQSEHRAAVLLTTTSRKLPKTQMATGGGRHAVLVEDANPSRSAAGGVQNTKKKTTATSKYLASNNGHSLYPETDAGKQYHVLKEKMANNNVIHSGGGGGGGGGYDKAEWVAQLNNVEVMNVVTSEFMDVKDVDAVGYDNKMAADSKDTRLYVMHDNNKRPNVRPRPASESHDISSSSANNNPWMANAALNNNGYADEAHAAAPIRQVKLPATPKRIKGATNGKKHSPPVHRVLLYSSQSPRLPRIAPSPACLQELRRTRNKSPALNVASNRGEAQESCNRTVVETNKGQTINCQVNVLKSMSPAFKTALEKNQNPNLKSVVAAGTLNDANRGAGGDSNDTAAAADNNNDNEPATSDDDDDDFDDLDNVSNYGDSGDSATTSDSEDGYRSHAYMLTHSVDRVAVTQSYLSSQTSEESLTNPESLLMPSLFPNVPPYLAFSSNTRKGPDVPAELYRVLKWRVTNVMPKVVRNVLSNSGMRMLKKTNDWMGVWGKHLKSPCFKTIRPYQKINHLPGSFKIGRKDACWRNLQKQMNKHGKKDFGFMPKTYIIPHDLNVLRKNWPKYAQRNVKWIIKPPASARGAGIRVVNRWAQIPKRKPLIVQKYIERPLLINGSKFDLRLYVLVTSINPLRVFMYHNGLARFASIKYSDKSDTLNDRCMHLTNYSINKFSSNYSKNEDVNACHGHKWTIKSLWTYLANRGIRTDILWEALRNLVLRTILAGENSINNTIKINTESKYSCYELFGFDVLLDSDLIPWLLEVNISPSLHSELPLDAHVKAPLVQAVLNTALFNVPPKLSLESQKEIAAEMSLPTGAPFCYDKRMYINYLSRAEKMKHNTFTRKTMEDRDEYINSILDNLTPDDVRCLIVAEDELARSAPLERIFPTNQTHKYLKYNESPRYYNRLLDAWESRYGHQRAKGIALLRDFCEEKYHLEVPPSPAKKHPQKYRTGALTRTRRLYGLALTTATRLKSKYRHTLRETSCHSNASEDDEDEDEDDDDDDENSKGDKDEDEDEEKKKDKQQEVVVVEAEATTKPPQAE